MLEWMFIADFMKIDQVWKLKWGHTHKAWLCHNPSPHPKKSMQKMGTMKLASNMRVIFIKEIHHFANTEITKYTVAVTNIIYDM